MPDGFDPHINSSYEMGIVLRSVYDTLIYRDPRTKEFVAGLAEKWAVSDDGLTYTFNLRKGVRFHDDTPFDANAVAKNLDRMIDPATKSQRAINLLGPYDHYTVVDANTIQIVLKSPYAPLLDGLSQVYTGIASPTAFRQYDWAQYQFHQAGTGPFYVQDYVPGDHITLRRNPDYLWGPKFYKAPDAASVDEVEFKFYADAAARAPALEKGEVDVIGELSPTDAILFTGNNNIRLLPQPIPGEPLQFLMNTTFAPTDNPELRRALLLATNRTAIVDAVFQQFSPVAYGPMSAGMLYYDPSVKGKYQYDPKAALDLLNNLGYAPKKQDASTGANTAPDKQLYLGEAKLHLVMVVPTWNNAPDVAQQIQNQWRDLGIELEVREIPNLAGLQDIVQKGEYNLIAYNEFGIDSNVVAQRYRSDSPGNWLHYGDSNLDSWIQRSTESLDVDTRQNMLTAVQGQVADQALTLPIRDFVNLNGARTTVQGLGFDAYGWNPLLPNLELVTPSKATPGGGS
jgi:peptide/nickel transport system substrate-binding protein